MRKKKVELWDSNWRIQVRIPSPLFELNKNCTLKIKKIIVANKKQSIVWMWSRILSFCNKNCTEPNIKSFVSGKSWFFLSISYHNHQAIRNESRGRKKKMICLRWEYKNALASIWITTIYSQKNIRRRWMKSFG